MIKRSDIVDTAKQLLGTRFLHQGRDKNGVDCVGLLCWVANQLGYEHSDLTDYRRIPSAADVRRMLEANADAVTDCDIKSGDFWLMRYNRLKPCHVSIVVDETSILHASVQGVRIEPVSNFPASWFVQGFRLRGVID